MASSLIGSAGYAFGAAASYPAYPTGGNPPDELTTDRVPNSSTPFFSYVNFVAGSVTGTSDFENGDYHENGDKQRRAVVGFRFTATGAAGELVQFFCYQGAGCYFRIEVDGVMVGDTSAQTGEQTWLTAPAPLVLQGLAAGPHDVRLYVVRRAGAAPATALLRFDGIRRSYYAAQPTTGPVMPDESRFLYAFGPEYIDTQGNTWTANINGANTDGTTPLDWDTTGYPVSGVLDNENAPLYRYCFVGLGITIAGLPAGNYTVRAHFMDPFSTSPDANRSGVIINGLPIVPAATIVGYVRPNGTAVSRYDVLIRESAAGALAVAAGASLVVTQPGSSAIISALELIRVS